MEQRDRWRSMESPLAQRAKEDAQRIRLRASRLLWRQLEDVRHSTELWKRTGLHLSHQVGAMHLHRGFSDAIHECKKEASHAWIEGDCRECVNDRRRIHRCAGRGTDRTLQTSHASASVARVRINKAGSSSTCGGSICILASIAIEIPVVCVCTRQLWLGDLPVHGKTRATLSNYENGIVGRLGLTEWSRI